MKKIYLFVLIFCLIFIFNCQTKEKKEIYDQVSLKKDILKQIKKADNYTNLFTLKEKYILHLKYGIGNIISMKLNKKYIGVLGRGNYTALYIFNKNNGKFLGKAGSRGKGPGDFLSISDFDFLKKDKILTYDIVLKRLNIYKIEKEKINHINSFLIKDDNLASLSQVSFINNKIYTFNNSGYQGEYKNFILDNKFNLIKKYDKFKHTSYVAWEPSVIKNNRIYVANEVWHSSSKALSKKPFKNAKCDKTIDVYDLNGNHLRKINSHIKQNFYKKPIYFNEAGTLMLIENKFVVDVNGKLIKRLEKKESFNKNEKFFKELPVSYNLNGIMKTFVPDRFTEKNNTIVVKVYKFL